MSLKFNIYPTVRLMIDWNRVTIGAQERQKTWIFSKSRCSFSFYSFDAQDAVQWIFFSFHSSYTILLRPFVYYILDLLSPLKLQYNSCNTTSKYNPPKSRLGCTKSNKTGLQFSLAPSLTFSIIVRVVISVIE